MQGCRWSEPNWDEATSGMPLPSQARWRSAINRAALRLSATKTAFRQPDRTHHYQDAPCLGLAALKLLARARCVRAAPPTERSEDGQ